MSDTNMDSNSGKKTTKKEKTNTKTKTDDDIPIQSFIREAGITEEHVEESSELLYEPLCIRKRTNWAKLDNAYKFDNRAFDPAKLLDDMSSYSPKMVALLKKIEALDKRDREKEGRLYKHFIFSDVRFNGYGAKLIASALLAKGMHLGYTAEKKQGFQSEGEDEGEDEIEGKIEVEPSQPNTPVSSTEEIIDTLRGSPKENPHPLTDQIMDTIRRSKNEEKEEEERQEGGEGEEEERVDSKKFGKIGLLPEAELLKTKGQNFFLLASINVFDQPIQVKTKKAILGAFNQRPDNVYGDLARIIVMDSGYKEGIDLFDIKYVHIFEPSTNAADQKQVIGRGTRTCGQKGLPFHPTQGWPLHVFIYDITIPASVSNKFMNSNTLFDLYMKSLHVDTRLFIFQQDLERVATFGSVDYDLNKVIHHFSIEKESEEEDDKDLYSGGSRSLSRKRRKRYNGEKGRGMKAGTGPGHVVSPLRNVIPFDQSQTLVKILNNKTPFKFQQLKEYIENRFAAFSWTDVKMENQCVTQEPNVLSPLRVLSPNQQQQQQQQQQQVKGGSLGGARKVLAEAVAANPFIRKDREKLLLKFTPTQNFIKNYFRPELPIKGMLLWHSVGTGKTCTAIATATDAFEREGYTILWVTRTTLKSDIWKNMFDQICSETFRQRILNEGFVSPKDQNERMRLLSPSWSIRPMSYKQFSNLVSKRNSLYDDLVKKNGTRDPLRKTLLIIDEAHKLYGGGDLSSVERPDMPALEAALQNSFIVSGAESVKVLLMTATPITANPMELIQLINLCKPIQEQLPAYFDDFAAAYLNEAGTFSQKGERAFLNAIAGNISYLNREKDARQFAQPIVHRIDVPMKIKDNALTRFDAKYVKEVANSELLLLRQEVAANEERIEKELKGPCAHLKSAERRECLKGVEDAIFRVKEEIRALKDAIQRKTREKEQLVAAIQENLEKDPAAAQEYMNSMYYLIQDNCIKKVSVDKLKTYIEKHPLIVAANQEMEELEQKAADYQKDIRIQFEAYKNRIRDLKDQLSGGDLNNNEALLLRKNLRSAEVDLAKAKDTTAHKKVVDGFHKTKKNVEEKRDGLGKRLRVTIKNYFEKEKAMRAAVEKEEALLRREREKQEELLDRLKQKEQEEAERKRKAEEQRIQKAEEQRILQEQKEQERARLQEEKRILQEQKEQERARLQEEKREREKQERQEQERIRKEEEIRMQEEERIRKEQDRIRLQQEKEEAKRIKEQERIRLQQEKEEERLRKEEEVRERERKAQEEAQRVKEMKDLEKQMKAIEKEEELERAQELKERQKAEVKAIKDAEKARLQQIKLEEREKLDAIKAADKERVRLLKEGEKTEKNRKQAENVGKKTRKVRNSSVLERVSPPRISPVQSVAPSLRVSPPRISSNRISPGPVQSVAPSLRLSPPRISSNRISPGPVQSVAPSLRVSPPRISSKRISPEPVQSVAPSLHVSPPRLVAPSLRLSPPKRANSSIRRRSSSPKRVTYKEVTPFIPVQAPVLRNPLLLEPIQRPPVSNILPPSLMEGQMDSYASAPESNSRLIKSSVINKQQPQPQQPQGGIMPSFSIQPNKRPTTGQVNFFRQPLSLKLPPGTAKPVAPGH